MRAGHYGILRIPRHAHDSSIRSAYRRRALATHPDKLGGSAAEFLDVVRAFEVLSDLVQRAAYDEDLRRNGDPDGLGNSEMSCEQPIEPRTSAVHPPTTHLEGTGPAEDRRVAELWHELMELPAEVRPGRVAALSFRSAERLLTYTESQACAGGAPIAATDGPAAPRSPVTNGLGIAGDPPSIARTESCATALLAFNKQDMPLACDNFAKPDAMSGASPKRSSDSEGPPLAKKPRVYTPRKGSRAWISLGNLKICTGSSDDVAEAVNWHILAVRIKQRFYEHARAGHPFDDSLIEAVATVLANRALEGGSDPRIRYVNEYTVAGTLFTPVTRDIHLALRQRVELESLRLRHASPQEVLEAIRRLTAVSTTAQEEQLVVVSRLRQHLKDFAKGLRWHGERPEGVNAVFSGEGTARAVCCYAEVWRPSESGLSLLCRGPRRKRIDEVLGDLSEIRGAQGIGGDEASKVKARQLYEDGRTLSQILPLPATQENSSRTLSDYSIQKSGHGGPLQQENYASVDLC